MQCRHSDAKFRFEQVKRFEAEAWTKTLAAREAKQIVQHKHSIYPTTELGGNNEIH